MNILAQTILRRLFDRHDTAGDLSKLPAAYRSTRGGLMSRIATAGILRLALRWPALSVILILSVVAARVMGSRRRRRADAYRPALPSRYRAPVASRSFGDRLS